jgi:hypothetical protein
MMVRTNNTLRVIAATAARHQNLVKLLPLMLLLLALASGVMADGLPGGAVCNGC